MLADSVGSATRLGSFESNSPEWHRLRREGIGGSDVAGICGVSPYSSPFKIWAVKTGQLEDSFVPSEAAEWGNRLESVVLDKFQEEHPELKVHRNVGTFANVERPWQLANPDAIYETADGKFGIVEIKTSRYEDDWQNDEPPVWYQTQVQWYASTFGFETPIFVAALFSGSKYREFIVEPDAFAQETYLKTVEEFLPLIVQVSPPEFDGAMATLETVRQLHPDIDPEETCDLGDLGVYYSLACTEFEQAQKHLNEMKARVLDAMGNAKRGFVEDILVVTRQARNGGTPYLVNARR